MKNHCSESEASKFLCLYPEEGTRVHKCFPLVNSREGILVEQINKPMFDFVPTLVEKFIGRQQEMYDVLYRVMQNRLVSILGPPGIGKTSLARNLANYIHDRRKFDDGILYISLIGCESAHMFLTRLILLIESCVPKKEWERHGGEDLNVDKEEDELDVASRKRLKRIITSVLKDKEVLLIMDNTEDPLEEDPVAFKHELGDILTNCPKVKMLVTSRKHINTLAHTSEQPYMLYALSFESSVNLLLKKSPRPISNNEINKLLKMQIPKDHKLRKLFPNESEQYTFVNHPFMKLLGGHPQAISLAAPMLEYKSLSELFHEFINKDFSALDYEVSSGTTSLNASLNISIDHLKSKCPDALTLFKFMGLLPGGINERDLITMLGQKEWQTKWVTQKDQLIRASLIVQKPDLQGSPFYTLLPFMSFRAEELLEEEHSLRMRFHLKTCAFLRSFC